MKKLYKYLAFCALGFVALAGLVFLKLGRERIMLWYYKYANLETLLGLAPFIAGFLFVVIVLFFVIRRYNRIAKIREEEEKAGIDLKDLFSNNDYK